MDPDSWLQAFRIGTRDNKDPTWTDIEQVPSD